MKSMDHSKLAIGMFAGGIAGILAALTFIGVLYTRSEADTRLLIVAEREKTRAEVAAVLARLETIEESLGIVTENAADVREELARQAEELAVQSNRPEPKSQDELLRGAVAGIAPSVVSIAVEVLRESVFTEVDEATGFFISSTGHIATNRHVVEEKNARYYAILNDGSRKKVSVVYLDPLVDFAILKLNGVSGIRPAVLGSSAGLAPGQLVFAIGNVFGEYENTVSVGVISALGRDIEARDSKGNKETLKNVIQTDAAINPGNSGGPLVNLNGEVVGVNVATIRGGQNISFAIPIDSVKSAVSAITR